MGGGTLTSFQIQSLLWQENPEVWHYQVRSLTGAAQLLKDNANVLRWAQRKQKTRSEQKETSFDLTLSIEEFLFL